MIVIVAFLLFVILGLGIFFFILMKELKKAPQDEASSLSKDGMALPSRAGASLFASGLIGGLGVPSLRNAHQDTKEAFVDKLDQKCLKLEQILDEKNRILAELEAELQNERSHRGEFESLKDILQNQIEDLKDQNRKLKDDLARILQDNLEAQGKIAGGASAIQAQRTDVIEAAGHPDGFSAAADS